MTRSKALLASCLLVSIAVLVPRPAHAYIDPGSGSYVLQILVGGLVAVSFAVKTFWNSLRGLFRRGTSPTRHD